MRNSKPDATFNRNTGMLTIIWQLDRQDCEAIGWALHAAGMDERGHITDQGFHDDDLAFIKLAEEAGKDED